MRNSGPTKSERPDLRPAFAVMRLITPSLRRSEGRCDQLGALSEPHRKRNLYANPKRTAKFSNNTSSDVVAEKRFKLFSKTLRSPDTFIDSLLTVWLQVKKRKNTLFLLDFRM